MVAEATSARKPRTPRPPAIPYVPQVEMIDYSSGAYSVQSQTNPTEFYLTTVGRDEATPTCTCKAGETGFQSCVHVEFCKHVRAAQIADSAITALIEQQQAREATRAARQQQASREQAAQGWTVTATDNPLTTAFA